MFSQITLLNFFCSQRTYTCRGFLPLLSSDLCRLDKDIRVPGITALFQVLSDNTSIQIHSCVHSASMHAFAFIEWYIFVLGK